MACHRRAAAPPSWSEHVRACGNVDRVAVAGVVDRLAQRAVAGATLADAVVAVGGRVHDENVGRARRQAPRAASASADRAAAISRLVPLARKVAMVFQHAGSCQPARAMYVLPARTITVFFLAKSRTETRPRTTRVSVDLQRSSTSHLVPTTVAALCLPLVRNLPSPSPHRRRFFLRLAAMLALPAFGQLQLLGQRQDRRRPVALRLPDLEDAAVEDGRVRAALVVAGGHDRHAALERVDGRADRQLRAAVGELGEAPGARPLDPDRAPRRDR